MPRYDVTLQDGRVVNVISANEDLAMKQASHQEKTRIVIATKRGLDPGADPASPVDIKKVKD